MSTMGSIVGAKGSSKVAPADEDASEAKTEDGKGSDGGDGGAATKSSTGRKTSTITPTNESFQRGKGEVENEIVSALHGAQVAGRRLRTMISSTAATLGLVISFLGLVLMLATPYASIAYYCGFFLIPIGILLLLLIVLPSYKASIPWLTSFLAMMIFLLAIFLPVGATAGVMSDLECLVKPDTWQANWQKNAAGNATEGGAPSWFCPFETGHFIAQEVGIFLLGVIAAYAAGWFSCLGLRIQSVSRRLRLIWVILALGSAGAGVIFLVEVIASNAAGYFERSEPWEFPCQIIRSFVMILVGCVAGWPGFRSRCQGFLTAMFSRKEGMAAAAGVAALVGGGDMKEAMADAEKLFRCVKLSQITQAEMANNEPNPALFARTEAATLGSVDAFISHSWSDDAPAKWVALQRWRSAFKQKHNREPTVWIDKCCIDQQDIDTQLRCLPVFLAGCRCLVAFVGETYISRMWCIMELFVYLQMRASTSTKKEVIASSYSGRMEMSSRGVEMGAKPLTSSASAKSHSDSRNDSWSQMQLIAVVPREGQGPEGTPQSVDESIAVLTNNFKAFDCDQCQCYGEETRQRLLAIVEAGFGTRNNFSINIQSMLRHHGMYDLGEGKQDQVSEGANQTPELKEVRKLTFNKEGQHLWETPSSFLQSDSKRGSSKKLHKSDPTN